MPSSVVQLNIRSSLAGQYRENVQFWTIDGHSEENPYSTANNFLVAWRSAVKAVFLACLPPDLQLDAILARVVGPNGGAYATIDFQDGEELGTRGTGAVSEQLCPCITLIPPMGTKSAGRIFMPAVDQADYGANAAAAGYVTAITNYMNVNMTGFSSSGGTAKLAIFSRKTNLVSNVSTWNLSPLIGYQRRRAKPIGL